MTRRAEWAVAVALSLGVALATCVPYALAERAVGPGDQFGGFLINPLDGYSYLAKMQQGYSGSWLFHLPYARESGAGALVYLYYLFLGHLAAWMGASLLRTYHAARVVAAALMFLGSFALYDLVFRERRPRWRAFVLTLVGSGLGWAALPLGRVAADLWIPEAIPFLTAYANAHFPLASAALLLGVVAVAGGEGAVPRRVFRSVLAAAAGFVLAVLQPFAVIPAATSLALWLVWDAATLSKQTDVGFLRLISARMPPFAAMLAASVPWLVYDYWLTQTNPAIAAWMAQNATPSPPLIDVFLGYGVILALACLALAAARPHASTPGRLLLAWVLVSAALLYAPFPLQRRLMLGLFFPLAALAAMGLEAIALAPRRAKVLWGAVLVLSLPSNMVVVATGLAGVQRHEPILVPTRAEIAGYTWIADNIPAGSLVLAAPLTGNRLPAFANVRVLYGHPFETPDADAQRALVERFFTASVDTEDALRRLDALGVDCVFYGPQERALGAPAWVESLEPVYDQDGVMVLRGVGP